MELIHLPYHADSSQVFSKFIDLPGAIYLDSCADQLSEVRYDIISALPYITLRTIGDKTQIIQEEKIKESSEDPFHLLKEILGTPVTKNTHYPFCGGAIGYFSYDLGRRLEKLPTFTESDIQLPDMHMGIYDWAIIFDHQERKTVLIAQHKDPKTKDIISFIENRFMSHKELIQESFQPLDPFKSNMDYSQYNHAFQKIKKHLHSGDCYQINLTQRFSTTLNEHSWSTYQYLRQKNPAPYSAYISLEEGSILSFSPERFLQVRDHQVETKPIKGTRPRSADLDKDKMLKDELQHSEKDKAENLMIVDLLRNDLGKNCIPGSIKVPKLFNIETFTTVHHLVSTITGTLRPNKHSLDLLRDCFPGGSITGTPKIRAMEIIEELEPHRRSVYCGAIGYISFDGDMDTNIAIRTLIQDKDQLHCSAGGAIVADSELQSEYEECLVKIKKITEALTVE